MENSLTKQKKVFLISGIPGSGKSTWINKQITENGGAWLSRDVERFALIKEGQDYFEKEKLVFNNWIRHINEAINNPNVENIYIDATHINDKSRSKVLNRLSNNNFKLIHVIFDVPLNICLARNAKRKGLERVPDEVIKKMSQNFEMPKIKGDIIIINKKGEVVKNG